LVRHCVTIKLDVHHSASIINQKQTPLFGVVKLFNAERFNLLTQNKLICHLLQQDGINHNNYALHSFKIGVTTAAAASDFLAWLVKSL